MKWAEINELNTFDEIVECDIGSPTAEEKSVIVKLDYYGKLCTPKNIALFKSGERWEAPGKYGVTANLCDGPLEKWFNELAEAIKYVKDRAEWRISKSEFGTEYGTWGLIGFTTDDCGLPIQTL